MRRRVYRLVGGALIAAAVAGLVFSLVAIVGVWRAERSMKRGLTTSLELLDTTLETTADALTIAGQSLDQANGSLDTLVDAIRTTGKTFSDTLPLIDSLTQVTTEAVPDTVSATQTALESAQSSAEVVDSTLTLLTSIPLLPIAPYDPDVPLSQALADVADSLDAIPESLAGMEGALENSSANLTEIGGQLEAIAGDIEAIDASLADARAVTSEYLQVITTLQQQVDLARASVPRRLDLIAVFLSLALVWLVVTQIGLMVQGFEMLAMDPWRRQPGD
jgi:hypothetical protein